MHVLAAARSVQAARAALTAAPVAAHGLRPLLTERAFDLVHGMLELADHGAPASPAGWAEVFDRAAVLSPEASVALYSLGDADQLEAATVEVVDWLRREGMLGRERRVLEIGCGIGRFLRALAGEVALAAGVDVSAVMCAETARRIAGSPGTGVIRTDGRDLAALKSGTFDLVLAVDSFPYLVSSGLTTETVAEAARLLSPAGEFVVLNWSYRGDPDEDRAEATAAAAAAGLHLAPEQGVELSHWDGAVFRFGRNPC